MIGTETVAPLDARDEEADDSDCEFRKVMKLMTAPKKSIPRLRLRKPEAGSDGLLRGGQRLLWPSDPYARKSSRPCDLGRVPQTLSKAKWTHETLARGKRRRECNELLPKRLLGKFTISPAYSGPP